MEEIQNYEGITHKITLPERVIKSAEFAILTGFMLQASILIGHGNKKLKILFINLIKQKLPQLSKDVENLFKQLKTLNINNFPSIIPHLLSIENIFLDTKIFFTDTPQNDRSYLISKALDLMIILKENSCADKHYCCADSNKPIKVFIIKEENRFFPGVNIDEVSQENVFYNYPASSKDDDSKVLRLLTKNLRNIGKFIIMKEKKNLQALIVDHPDSFLNDKTKKNLLYYLEDPSGCVAHSKVIFPCGSMHCKQCEKDKGLKDTSKLMKCPCGIDFSGTQVFQLTTFMATTMSTKINAPPSFDNKSTSDTNKIAAPPNTSSNSSNPIVTSIKSEENQTINAIPCWVCNQNIIGNGFSTCNIHIICSNCAELAKVVGFICVTCPVCQTHAFAPHSYKVDNEFYHINCYNQNFQVYQQPNLVICWGCMQEYPDENCGHCESNHSICNNCFQNMDNYCSPCHGVLCLACDKYILKSQACEKDGIFFHLQCLSYTINFSLNNHFQ